MISLSFSVPGPFEVPRPDEPIFPAEEAPSPADRIPNYGDDIWSTRFFSNNPSVSDNRFNWLTFPERFREHFRFAAWALFNVQLSHEVLQTRNGPMVSRLSALRIYHTMTDWRQFARWMKSQGVDSIEHVAVGHFESYARYLSEERGIARATAVNHLSALTRLWMIGLHVPALKLLATPPWLTHPLSDYLPAGKGASGENATEPISTRTMSAMLDSANQFIEIAAEPILAATQLDRAVYDWSRHRSARRQGSGQVLRTYLEGLRADGAPVPVKRHNGRIATDCAFIAYTTGVALNTVYGWMSNTSDAKQYASANSAETSVDLRGHELLPATVPLTRVSTYRGLLRTACYIVIAYLTGMRPGEVLALEAGCLRPSAVSGGWMLIRSRTFKTAKDDDGNHDSNGHVREAPWVAVAPVIRAIRVLELIANADGLLFPSDREADGGRRSIGSTTAADSVLRFIDYVNERCPGRIPNDEHGRVTPIRFRRTLAWHIANQPGGLIALAVQYGHLRTAISEGYASRMRNGIQDLVDFETARTIALKLGELSEELEDGGAVSGPAARRLVSALREQAEEFSGVVTSRQQARALLRNPNVTVFENEQAFVWCNFNRETALCLNDRSAADALAPRLDNCKSKCSNIARTDKQAVQLRLSATRLRDDARVMPQPAAERLLVRADELDALATRHNEQRTVLGEMDAGSG